MMPVGDLDPWRCLSVSAAQPIGLMRAARHMDYGAERYTDFDLWIGVAGHGTVELGGRCLDFGAGTVVLAMPDVPIRQRTDGRAPIEVAYVHFDCFINGRRVRSVRGCADIEQLTLTLPRLPPISLVGRVDALPLAARLMTARTRLDDDAAHLELNILILQVLQRLRCTHLHPAQANSLEPSRIDRAVQYMHKHLDRPMRLEEVAEFVDVSLPTLRRMFHRQLRLSPGHYLHHLRMARARDLLRGGNFTVAEAAEACGFNSAPFFSRVFKTEHGIPPRDFARLSRALP